ARGPRGGEGAEALLEAEPQVVEQAIDPEQREPPPPVEPRLADQVRERLEDRVAVGLEHGLGELDAAGSTVALDLALVRVELHTIQMPVFEPGAGGLVEGRQQIAPQPRRIAGEADPEVRLRVRMADEEPAARLPG